MNCEVWKIEFNPGDTFRQVCTIENQSDGTKVSLTGCTAQLQFSLGGVPLMNFSSANGSTPTAGQGQIIIASDQTTNAPDRGSLTFYADDSVANVLQAGASGLLKITWSNGDTQTILCAEIVPCEC